MQRGARAFFCESAPVQRGAQSARRHFGGRALLYWFFQYISHRRFYIGFSYIFPRPRAPILVFSIYFSQCMLRLWRSRALFSYSLWPTLAVLIIS